VGDALIVLSTTFECAAQLVVSNLEDDPEVVIDEVDESIRFVDATRSSSREGVLQRFRLADALHRVVAAEGVFEIRRLMRSRVRRSRLCQ